MPRNNSRGNRCLVILIRRLCLGWEDKHNYNHPTIKPEELINKLIINSSKENDLVFDCFLGSGTTCVCAKNLKRNYLGFEIDKKYFEIAQDRLNGISQKEKADKENGMMNIFDFI